MYTVTVLLIVCQSSHCVEEIFCFYLGPGIRLIPSLCTQVGWHLVFCRTVMHPVVHSS
jgi:hypothetical protein